jgi:hypothetical protein
VLSLGQNRWKWVCIRSQLKKEIGENHASVIASGNTAPNAFYIDYKDGDIKGRITISGSAKRRSYLLAQLTESNKS